MKKLNAQSIGVSIKGFVLVCALLFFSSFTYTLFFDPQTESKLIKKLNLEGLVTIDGKPTAAHVEIHSSHKNKNFIFNTFADKKHGVFRVFLPLGDQYEVVVRVNKFPQQIISVNAEHIDTTSYMNIFADFISPAYDKKIHELQLSILAQQNQKEKNFDGNSFAKKHGNTKKEGLVYRVQIGAFKLFENFNYSGLVGMPKIIRKTDTDNVTRFTMGNYETYNEAKQLLELVRKNDLKEAFIISYYKGERKFLFQLGSDKVLL